MVWCLSPSDLLQYLQTRTSLRTSSSAARLQHTQKGPHNKRISSFQKFNNRYISLINNGTATFSTDMFIHRCQQW